MKSLEKLYKTDENLSINGVEITVGYNEKDEPVIMIIAEAGNPNHTKAQRRHSRALESSRNSDKRRKLVMSEIIYDGKILRGWKGVLDSKGKEVPFTRENAIEALTKYDRLMSDVISAADDPMNFRPEEEIIEKEESEKNSGKSSSGLSSTESS